MILHGKRVDTSQPVAIQIEGKCVTSIAAVEDADEQLPWIGPGLIDLQVNGYGGQEFNDPSLTEAHVEQISIALDRDGVTGYCPTTTTHSYQMLSHALATIARARESSAAVSARVVGIHLEGPYISPEDGPRGAHPAEHVRPPDWNEFQKLQDAALGSIRILTLSPHYEGSAEFIRRVADSGVLVAIGHTSADAQQIAAAIDAGARMSTHLGNGAHAQIRRHPNYIWDQLAEDRLTASLIADRHHLPPAVLKSMVRGKTPARCVLVSDVTGMAGMPPGRYENTSVGAVEVLEDGRLVVAGQRQYLAGAALPMTVGIANLTRFTDVDLATAYRMASDMPAGLIGCRTGGFQVGDPADFNLFELPKDDRSGIKIVRTVNQGEVVFG